MLHKLDLGLNDLFDALLNHVGQGEALPFDIVEIVLRAKLQFAARVLGPVPKHRLLYIEVADLVFILDVFRDLLRYRLFAVVNYRLVKVPLIAILDRVLELARFEEGRHDKGVRTRHPVLDKM